MNINISILMPYKNAAAFLTPCLDSIVQQSFAQWELICINDHSTDSSEKIVRTYAAKDQRITTYLNTDVGIIPALRMAYTKSTGDLITRMDADDLMPNNKLELLKYLLDQHGKGAVATGCVQYFSDQSLGNGYIQYQHWLNDLMKNNNHFNQIYKECVIPSPAWMMHRTDLDRIGAFNPNRYPEDYDLCFRMYRSSLRVVSSAQLVHRWRDHPTRTSRTSSVYRDNSFLRLKTDYFLEIDYKPDRQLVLWGAGHKAKSIARLLISKQVQFDWICNNSKKIGHAIYGIILKDSLDYSLSKLQQFIITPANPLDQYEIRAQLVAAELSCGNDYFLFS